MTPGAINATLALAITVDPRNVTDRVGPLMYGSGIETYEHQMYGGLWSNVVYDDSLEDAALGSLATSPRQSWFQRDSNCSITDKPIAFNGKHSLALGPGCAALNRGLVAAPTATSMHWVGGRSYDGYFFWTTAGTTDHQDAGSIDVTLLCAPVGDISAANASSVGNVRVTLDPSVPPAAGDWRMVNFTVTAAADCLQGAAAASMGFVRVSTPPAPKEGIAASSAVLVDKLMLEPGEWGRYNGLHIRKDLAELFLGQRPAVMRLGGSMTNAPGFRFHFMVGPPWSRPPTDSGWIPTTSWGFGMFEFVQFAELAGIHPVLCLNFAEDMAGLLEYMYGDPHATQWGRQRATDGHPSPYTRNITFICSNEEPQQDSGGDFARYITAWTAWIAEFKRSAKRLGVWPLRVGVAMDSGASRRFSPGNEDKFSGGSHEMLRAIFAAGLNDTEVVWDQHGDGGVAAGWGDENRDWEALLSLPNNNSMEALSKAGGKWVKTVMLEENGGGCGLGRALGHVSNSLSLQRIGHQVVMQCAAGIWTSGPSGLKSGDYQIKFLADRFVVAPFWHAQRMLADSHQPNICGGYHTIYNGSRGNPDLVFSDWMAAVSDSGATLVLRIQNPNAEAIDLDASIMGGPWLTHVNVVTLSGDSLSAENDFNTPNAVAPVYSTLVTTGRRIRTSLAPFSFTVLTLLRA
mmetsp:Transcript_17296/g.45102  ORF Transcript_17296/g.45102 Transcript_17296/m.45102 type:complete len:686 (+) Transcript_17296:304-2361(+)